MVYMPTANLFVSADANGAVNVWDFRTSARLQELDGPTSEVAPPTALRPPARPRCPLTRHGRQSARPAPRRRSFS
jgi:hypothetical protein